MSGCSLLKYPVKRLKPSELRAYRDRELKLNNLCRVCMKPILPEEAVLDHDHETGHIREVLHRQCNQIEGRVLSWCTRNGRQVHPVTILKGVLELWEKDFSKNPYHPTHLSEPEKEIKRLRKAMKKLKRQATKDKYALKIKQLQGTV